jgi:glycosyltransferase involved in cell wall biosynthesis
MKISVIICSHNPRRDYLARVLAALQAQTLPLADWELLLIDNASAEPLEGRFGLSWHPNARHVREEELGLTPARLRGIADGAAPLLIFVDDDNILAPDYLAEAVRISTEWHQLGVWGGSIVPDFETEPPQELTPFLRVLALREVGRHYWTNVDICYQAQPWGAGICVRSDVAGAYRQHVLNSIIRLSGRRGKSLTSSEDSELCYVACSLGKGMGVFPELKVTHLIPKERLEIAYVLRLTQSLNASNMLLSYKWHGVMPPTPYSPERLVELVRVCLRARGISRKIFFAKRRAAFEARDTIKRIGNVASSSAK